LIGALFGLVGIAAGIVLLPVFQIIPKTPFIHLARYLFKFGYNIYLGWYVDAQKILFLTYAFSNKVVGHGSTGL
jgi:hypothetical protein